jgi:hypothetical protein
MTIPPNPSMERLIALVQRELGAVSVRLLEAASEPSEAENVLYAQLPDGRRLAVAFAAPPASRDVALRRLRMLTATFSQSLSEGPRSSPRPPVSGSLHQELRALAVRARALDAAVIDAHSPVVWGAGSQDLEAETPEKINLMDVSSARLVEIAAPSSQAPVQGEADDASEAQLPPDAAASRGNVESVRELTERAVELARDLPGLPALRKGGHVAQVVEAPDLVVLVRSFASIYVLLVIYDAPFDEVRAERAVEDSLPRIERFVLALPPLDPKPAPIAGVISMRRGRRR